MTQRNVGIKQAGCEGEKPDVGRGGGVREADASLGGKVELAQGSVPPPAHAQGASGLPASLGRGLMEA